jgi:cytochrome c oxidase cbb3-type subunit 3
MADFTNYYVDLFVAIVTVLSVIGCGVLLWSQSKYRVEHDAPTDGTTGHVWDEDLTELNTPLPRWWMWMFYLTIVFGMAYLLLYPGLGSFKGKLGWESAGEYKAELAKAKAEYDPLFAKYQGQDIRAVAGDAQAQAIGERLFLTYCAQCHGSDAKGSKGFPDLTDKDWLHGGDPDTIKLTILKGRHGQMPPMAAALGSEQDVQNVVHYVKSLSGLTADPVKVTLGKPKFAACAACHGANGQGNPMLGAPNLADKVWLYGGSAESILDTIRNGRSNRMPAFDEFLGEPKAHVLAAYVWSLSNPVPVVAQGSAGAQAATR